MHELLEAVLASMIRGPEDLDSTMAFISNRRKGTPISQHDIVSSAAGRSGLTELFDLWDRFVKTCDFASADEEWTEGSVANSRERRDLIYGRLGACDLLREATEARIPISQEEKAVVIAQKNEFPGWYDETRRLFRPYWKSYREVLRRSGRWDGTNIEMLNVASDDVLRRMADPFSAEAYQSKGLVFGYVQSGKTANFTAVIAKGIDAGYRLIIVMAGTTDELRNQTQRRLDKELEAYAIKGPPRTPKLEMLTKVGEDYEELGYGLNKLGFGKISEGTFNTPGNLAKAHAVVIVVKKLSSRLETLIGDLQKVSEESLGRPWAEVPAMIIDDESDLASINTRQIIIGKDDKESTEIFQKRTACNGQIVKLLRMLPRCQYVGYTATPAANLLVDKTDPADIFPKDYVVSLPKPVDYVGASYFMDLEAKTPTCPRPNKDAFVREIGSKDEDKRRTLRSAIDLFVLTGAVKLYRIANARDLIEKGKLIDAFHHHTMLVHCSYLKRQHAILAKKVSKMFDDAGYAGGKGLDRLRDLYETDIRRVSLERCSDMERMAPASFAEIVPFIQRCLNKVKEDEAPAAIFVNSSDDATTPEFDKRPYWKILVGGTKLSRGFTVEGLTISYYTRSVATADTLSQMGRWYGFRHGYADLIRLFIATKARIGGNGKNGKDLNLYEAFEACCRDEENLRRQLRRNDLAGMTPEEAVIHIPASLLMPTAKNKSRSAVDGIKDLAKQFTEATVTSRTEVGKRANRDLERRFIASVKDLSRRTFEATWEGEGMVKKSCLAGIVTHGELLSFVRSFEFASPGSFLDRLGYLEGGNHDPEIDDWVVMIPEGDEARGRSIEVDGRRLWLRHRSRRKSAAGGEANAKSTFTSQGERPICEYIAHHRNDGQTLSEDLTNLRAARRGVIMLFNTVPNENDMKLKDEKLLQVYEPGFTLHVPPRHSGSKMARRHLVQKADLRREPEIAT